jgi:hypothetical protein
VNDSFADFPDWLQVNDSFADLPDRLQASLAIGRIFVPLIRPSAGLYAGCGNAASSEGQNSFEVLTAVDADQAQDRSPRHQLAAEAAEMAGLEIRIASSGHGANRE